MQEIALMGMLNIARDCTLMCVVNIASVECECVC